MRRLRDFDRVVVTPQPTSGAVRVGSLDCQVIAVIGQTAALEPLDRAQALWLPERMEALLSFQYGRSLVGLKGLLSQRSGTDDLRFTVTDGVQLPGREASRITICAPIALRRAGSADEHEGLTVNLSATGILASCPLDAHVGEDVELSLSLPEADEPFEGAARVVREADGLVALQIDGAEQALRVRLGRFTVAHNRAVIRRGPVAALELDF